MNEPNRSAEKKEYKKPLTIFEATDKSIRESSEAKAESPSETDIISAIPTKSEKIKKLFNNLF